MKKDGTPPPTHLVLPPTMSYDWRLALRPISQFPLARSTIIQTNAKTAKEDYRALYARSVISTYVLEDRCDYELKFLEVSAASKVMLPQTPFEAFATYSYPAKKATNTSGTRNLLAEENLPKPASENIVAKVTDWVQKISEPQDPPSTTQKSHDNTLPDSKAHLPHELRAAVELPHTRKPQGSNASDSFEGSKPCSASGQHFESPGLKNESLQQEGLQKLLADEEEEPTIGIHTSAEDRGRPVNSLTVTTGRANIFSPLSSNLADLVGLSIPINSEVGDLNKQLEYPLLEPHENIPQTPTLEPSRNTHVSQRSKQKDSVNDLLGTDDREVLKHLMRPLVPMSTPHLSHMESVPQREYRWTMNQKAPDKGRGQVQRRHGTPGRPFPSRSPSSAQRRSKIPVKSRAQVFGNTKDAKQTISSGGSGVVREAAPDAVKASKFSGDPRYQGCWTTGQREGTYSKLVIPPILQDSIKGRPYFERALEELLASMLNRARMTTGKVSMEISFSRIVIEDVNEKVIKFDLWDEAEQNFHPSRFLNELALFKERNYRWHTILSLDGGDANKLKEVSWMGDSVHKWNLVDATVFYDFSCEDLEQDCRFIVQVNARDFTYTFESQRFALDDVIFIHCPDRSWDLNAYVKSTDTGYFKDKYDEFARSLIESLEVP